jgi:sodium pump decarboxylase gamma subunit
MDEMMAGALELMILGMSVVFSFLSALVVATWLMSRVARRLQGPESPGPARTAAPPGLPADPRLQRAIQLAVAQHRKRHHGG